MQDLDGKPEWGRWTAADYVELLTRGVEGVAAGKLGWRKDGGPILDGYDHWLYHGIPSRETGTYDIVSDLFDARAVAKITNKNYLASEHLVRDYHAGIGPKQISRHLEIKLESDVIDRAASDRVARELQRLGLMPSVINLTGDDRLPERFSVLYPILGRSTHFRYIIAGGVDVKDPARLRKYRELQKIIFAIFEVLAVKTSRKCKKAPARGSIFDEQVTFVPGHHLRMPGHYSINNETHHIRLHTITHLAREGWDLDALYDHACKVARHLKINLAREVSRKIETRATSTRSTFDPRQEVDFHGSKKSFLDIYNSTPIGRKAGPFKLPGDTSTRGSAHVVREDGFLRGFDYAATSPHPRFIVEIEPGSSLSSQRGMATKCEVAEDYVHIKDWVGDLPEGNLLLGQALGHGKSTAIRKITTGADDDRRNLFVAPFRILTDVVSRNAGVASYSAGPSFTGDLATCVPSLHKTRPVLGQNFVLEEVNGIIETLFSLDKNPRRTFEAMRSHAAIALAGGGRVLANEAFITPSARKLIEILTEGDFEVCEHPEGYYPLHGKTYYRLESIGDIINKVIFLVEQAAEEGVSPRIAISCIHKSTIKFFEGLFDKLAEKHDQTWKTLSLHGDTPDGIRDGLRDGTLDIDKFDFLLYNKAAESGISIDGEWTPVMIGERVGGSPTPYRDLRQMAGRVRNPINGKGYYYIEDAAFADLPTDIDALREAELKSIENHKDDLKYILDDNHQITLAPIDQELFELRLQFQIDRNRASQNVAQQYTDSLVREGARIVPLPTDAAAAAATKLIAKFKKDARKEFIEEVLQADFVSRDEMQEGVITSAEATKRRTAERWGRLDDDLIEDTATNSKLYHQALRLASIIAVYHPDQTPLHVQRQRRAKACFDIKGGVAYFDFTKWRDHESEARFYGQILKLLNFPMQDFALAAHPHRDRDGVREFSISKDRLELGSKIHAWAYGPADVDRAWGDIVQLVAEHKATTRLRLPAPEGITLPEYRMQWVGRVLARIGLDKKRMRRLTGRAAALGLKSIKNEKFRDFVELCDRPLRKLLGLEVEAVEELFEVTERRLAGLDEYIDASPRKSVDEWRYLGYVVDIIDDLDDISGLHVAISDRETFGKVEGGGEVLYLIPKDRIKPLLKKAAPDSATYARICEKLKIAA